MVKLLPALAAAFFLTLPIGNAVGAAPKSKSRPSKIKKEAQPVEWKGAFCSVSSSSYRIVHSNEEWLKLWEEIGKPAPAADLKGRFAVAIFAGIRNTGGYNVVFEKPMETDSKITVRYRITTPPKDAMVIQALTQPFGVRLYPRTEKSIDVEAVNP